MQPLRMQTMLTGVLWIDVVPDEIDRSDHQILNAHLQWCDVVWRQISVIHRIDDDAGQQARNGA